MVEYSTGLLRHREISRADDELWGRYPGAYARTD
jgi:hypothetical protein